MMKFLKIVTRFSRLPNYVFYMNIFEKKIDPFFLSRTSGRGVSRRTANTCVGDQNAFIFSVISSVN